MRLWYSRLGATPGPLSAIGFQTGPSVVCPEPGPVRYPVSWSVATMTRVSPQLLCSSHQAEHRIDRAVEGDLLLDQQAGLIIVRGPVGSAALDHQEETVRVLIKDVDGCRGHLRQGRNIGDRRHGVGGRVDHACGQPVLLESAPRLEQPDARSDVGPEASA